MSCYCDIERPEFFSSATQFARVAHRCGECGRLIKEGEQYQYNSGKWDGEFTVHKRCLHCCTVVSALREALPCYCDYFGGVWETIADGWLDDLKSAETGDYFRVMRLVVAAKRAKREAGR